MPSRGSSQNTRSPVKTGLFLYAFRRRISIRRRKIRSGITQFMQIYMSWTKKTLAKDDKHVYVKYGNPGQTRLSIISNLWEGWI